MKAKEFFEKYETGLISTDTTIYSKAAADLLIEMSEEVKEIAKMRHAKYDSAVISIIDEQNTKFNAIVTMFEKKYGASPLVRNGLINFWKAKIPELNEPKRW